MIFRSITSFLLLIAGVLQALVFTKTPSMVKDAGSTWKIEFAVNESTDVEVSIVNTADSSVVRHLVAGKLGTNPPLPLVAGTLSQTLIWDGKDDYRKPVTNTSNINVRVRAGMDVRLHQSVGGDPYAFYAPGQDRRVWLNGLEQGSDGSVFVLARSGIFQSKFLRRFTPKGEYVKTLFPLTGNQPAEAKSWWGLNELENGENVPQSKGFLEVGQTSSPLGVTWARNPCLVPVHGNGQIGIMTYGFHHGTVDDAMLGALPPFTLWMMKEDGTRDLACVNETKNLTNGPVIMPTGKWDRGDMGGMNFMAMTPDRADFYVTSLYGSKDSVLWRECAIVKVNMQTRMATPFYSLDTVIRDETGRRTLLGSSTSSMLQGIAVDDSGRVFVCDRLHNRVLIIDNKGVLLRTITVMNPDNLTLSKRTGALYVTTHSSSTLSIRKFANWRTDDVATCSVVRSIGYEYYFPKSFVTACETDEGTLVWLGFWQTGVLIFKDEGTALNLYKDFNELNTQSFTGLYHVNVDSKTETPYLDANWNCVFKIPDWNQPKFVRCTTSTGTPLVGQDMAIDPVGRYMYLRGTDASAFQGHVHRYTLDARPVPAPLPGKSGSKFTDTLITVAGTNAVTADMGFAVAPNGHLAVMSWLTTWPVPAPYTSAQTAIRYFSFNNTVSAPLETRRVFSKTDGKCIRFDLAGNIYVGRGPVSPNVNIPAALKNDPAYRATIGSIYKYAADGAFESDLFIDSNPPVAKLYDIDYGPMGDPGCACVGARFGVDAFGRLYSPNSLFQKVTIMDNAGNRISRIGTYGNIDDLKDELNGKAGTKGKCTMGYPIGVDATDDYIYVTDATNYTLLRIQKTFVLDNIPMSHTPIVADGADVGNVVLRSSPNPFNPESRISFNLPTSSIVRLDVYDVNGRFVKNLVSGKMNSGTHKVSWNAKDAKGHAVSGGVYVYRLTAGNKIINLRTVLAK